MLRIMKCGWSSPRLFSPLPPIGHAEREPTGRAAFLDQAIAGLAEEGKVISVRLALFAEMMKAAPGRRPPSQKWGERRAWASRFSKRPSAPIRPRRSIAITRRPPAPCSRAVARDGQQHQRQLRSHGSCWRPAATEAAWMTSTMCCGFSTANCDSSRRPKVVIMLRMRKPRGGGGKCKIADESPSAKEDRARALVAGSSAIPPRSRGAYDSQFTSSRTTISFPACATGSRGSSARRAAAGPSCGWPNAPPSGTPNPKTAACRPSGKT